MKAKFDEFGAQIPDDTPVELPIRLRRSGRDVSTAEIQRLVRIELSKAASAGGYDSIEEADDFEVDDDEPEFSSQFEMREEFERLVSDRVMKPVASLPVVGSGGTPAAPQAPSVEAVKPDES